MMSPEAVAARAAQCELKTRVGSICGAAANAGVTTVAIPAINDLPRPVEQNLIKSYSFGAPFIDQTRMTAFGLK